MKFLYLSIFLLAMSCGAPKSNTSKSEAGSSQNSETKIENQLIVVLNNPNSIQNVKSLVKNSGLTWKDMILDSPTSKIGVIEIPDGKYDFWIDRLQNTDEFRTVGVNSKELADELVNREKNTLISIRKTQCLGDCPAYEVYIDNLGNLTYTGNAYVIEKGIKKFKLSDKEFAILKEKLGKKSFTSFKEVYDNPRIMDLPSTYITHDGKQIKIRLWSDDVPEELMDINEYIEGILLEKKFFE
ncbi:DUF6438 domain-containing protein [Tenacibaculum amylolyticum]|uniref:DUF6438 domain-containing protein n=1 Tax=Tenacibaculum amylolyticum TaxID=104269 RepID=UPI003895C1ED